MTFMLSLVLAGMGCALIALFLGTGATLRRSERPVSEPSRWPRASVVLPLQHAFPRLRQCLESVMDQDYPEAEWVFVTERADDGAVPEIDRLRRLHGNRVRHVVAGTATHCGQKNHSLLAGVLQTSPRTEVLVFCDSSHVADRRWLRELLRPIAAGRTNIATSYHVVTTDSWTVAAAGRAMAVQFMHALQLTPGLSQTWGGSTAIRRETFLARNIADIWLRTVVDDVTLSLAVNGKEHIEPCPRAKMYTRLDSSRWSDWLHWQERQWVYLKYYWPGSWFLAGLFEYTLTLCAIISLIIVALALPCGLGAQQVLFPALFVVTLTGLALGFRARQPEPPPAGVWLMGFFACLGMATIAHLCNWKRHNLVWAGKTYIVNSSGTLVGMEHTPPTEPTEHPPRG